MVKNLFDTKLNIFWIRLWAGRDTTKISLGPKKLLTVLWGIPLSKELLCKWLCPGSVQACWPSGGCLPPLWAAGWTKPFT